MAPAIGGLCISANQTQEFNAVRDLILEMSPNTKICRFQDVIHDISLLDDVDYIMTIGGDGSVAWLIGTFYEVFGTVDHLKPIIPVIRPESVGYLKQIDLEKTKFRYGFQNLLDGKFTTHNRTILRTNINGKAHVAVNEIYMRCSPHLGMFSVYFERGGHLQHMTTTMADGCMVSNSIGSSGWSLSYNGQINLNEDALELVFVGGIHSSSNFVLPRTTIQINLKLKNSSIIGETVEAYDYARQALHLAEDADGEATLNIVYGPRVIIDGKLVAFGLTKLSIDSQMAIPFVFLYQETDIDKARKLTRQPSVK